MNIGLMTWYTYYNYGTSLQAVALNKAINKLGNRTVIIKYIPKGNVKKINNIKDISLKIKNKIYNQNVNSSERNMIFEKFLDANIRQTELCNTYAELKELNEKFDAFVCGSDQIWSPLVFDDKYFLSFADEYKIISYAPSMGSNKIENLIIADKMKELISRFKYLSIREETGKKIIKDLTGKDAKVVLDPTLLLNKDEWKKFENVKVLNKINNKYILCYFLGDSNKYFKQIEKYAKNNNLTIYNLPVFKNKKINKYNINENIGPAEFISLIKNAECVFTDSYHGTIFSINFNKKFYTYKRFKDNDPKNQNSRVLDILNKFELNNRLIDNRLIINNDDIDYTNVNIKLKELRNDSINYLKQSLENISKESINNKMEQYGITSYCSGCGACASICPKGAIKIVENQEGFQHYNIDKEKCIECGLCKKVCPMLKLDTMELKNAKNLYSFKAKNEKVLKESSSGGFSYILSKIYNKDYYICGSYYNNEKDIAEHILIEPKNENELKKIQGSKYIQSNTSSIMKKLMELPKNAKVIFFRNTMSSSWIR